MGRKRVRTIALIVCAALLWDNYGSHTEWIRANAAGFNIISAAEQFSADGAKKTVQQEENPSGKIENPPKEGENPSKEPENPSKEPVEPSKEPVEPSKEPEEPSKEPVEPSEEPENPSTEPETSSPEPELPSTEPEFPSTEPELPSTEPELPSTETEENPSQTEEETTVEQPGDETVSDNTLSGNQTLSGNGISANQLSARFQSYGQTNLPLTAGEYQAGGTYIIKFTGDFLVLQDISAEIDFAGMFFEIASPDDGGNCWELDKIAGFTGIGTENFPFKGNMRCAYDSGVTFQFSKPLFRYLGDGAKVNNMAITCLAGSEASIANTVVRGSGVAFEGISINGSLGNPGAEAVGGLLARAEEDVVLSLQKISIKAELSGQNAGGLIGVMKKGGELQMPDSPGTVKVEGTVTAAVAAGGLFGLCEADYSYDMAGKTLQNTAAISGSGNTSAAGTLAGILRSMKLTLKAESPTTFPSKVGGDGISGGIAGKMEQVTLTAEQTVEIGGSVSGAVAGGMAGELSGSSRINLQDCTITAVINASGEAAGGLFGYVRNEPLLEMQNDDRIVIRGNVKAVAGSAGGIIGRMQDATLALPETEVHSSIEGINVGGMIGNLNGGSKVLLVNPAFQGGVTGVGNTSNAGGILGSADSGCAMELQGRISLTTGTVKGTNQGHVVGKQTEAFLYMSRDAQLEKSSEDMDEAGVYGGIFRNQAEGGGALIGDGTLSGVGKINRVVSGGGGAYTFSSPSDFIALAAVLHSQGNYGREAFGNITAEALLLARITLNASVDLSYDSTGIVTLNRNDDASLGRAFKGMLQGTPGDVTITKNITTKQSAVGLFSSIGGSTFRNFTLQGTITNANGAGGLAYQAVGVGQELNWENIRNQTGITVTNGNTAALYGGFLAKTNDAVTIKGSNLTVSSLINTGRNGSGSGLISQIKEANLDLSGITVTGSMSTTQTGNTGGFLGHTWENTGGRIQNITVRGAALATKGTYGGLVYKVTTKSKRLTLENVTYDSVTITGGGKSGCGLLLADATSLVLEVIDYRVNYGGCTFTTPGNPFDEVAGKTRNTNDALTDNGIISLHSTTNNYPAYHYENQAGSKTNGNTRYYYDLFQMWEREVIVNGVTQTEVRPDIKVTGNLLDMPEKVMLWHIFHTARTGIVRNYFIQYSPLSGETYTLQGNLDMTNYSLYPTPGVNGGKYSGDNARITFQAQDWAQPAGQHSALQGGLFKNPSNLSAELLTLVGSVMYQGADSGALVNGTLNGGGTITDITLDNLWLKGYTGQKIAAGLMIGSIPTGKVSLEGVTMSGYAGPSAAKAAAALIGNAGSANEKNLILDFKEMTIADDIEGQNRHNGDVLAHASFLYQYAYTDDTSTNKGRGLYLFTEADAKNTGLVTYGKELDGATEYQDNTKLVLTDLGINQVDYKPYVLAVKEIEVNPKTGDILQGCGTYEDPYIISTSRQLLTLYRYINETGTPGNYQYQHFYSGWSIIKAGTDQTFCSTKHDVVRKPDGTLTGVGLQDVRSFGAADFPVPDVLSRAYYMLGEDIDLSEDKLGGTYKIIAREFVGFGTKERPFTGVWMGAGKAITLPEKKATSTYATYGFIQYAKGAVVKDLVLAGSTDAAKAAVVTDMGGTVFACLLGGDNIIDNVTVKARLKARDGKANIGGYVGNIKKGTLILRNVAHSDVESFQAYTMGGTQIKAADAAYSTVGQLLGLVEDGCVVYEGVADTSVALWEKASGYPLAALPLPVSPSYSIVNGSYLDQQTTGVSVVKKPSGTNTEVEISLPNAASLFAMSAALNADALSILPTNHAYQSGYNGVSRSRKAAYRDVGSCTVPTPDYIAAVTYDNANGYQSGNDEAWAYPYLYRYFNIDGNAYKDYLTPEKESMLNTISPKAYRTTYTLAAGGTYDMSLFADSFRGIGAMYIGGQDVTGDGRGGTFRANFNGNDSVINIEIKRSAATAGATLAGLFNRLCADAQIPAGDYVAFGDYTISNFTLQGSIDNGGGNIQRSGGVAAEVKSGRYSLKKIAIDEGFEIVTDDSVTTSSYVGGLTGAVTPAGALSIQGCTVGKTGNAPNQQVKLKGYQTGGLAGFVSGDTSTLTVGELCRVNNVLITAGQHAGGAAGYITEKAMFTLKEGFQAKNIIISSGGSAGGVIGYSDTVKKTVLSGKDSNQRCQVEDAKITTTRWQAGGLAGEIRDAAEIKFASVTGVTVTAPQKAGGLVGELTTPKKTSVMNDVVVSRTVIKGSGAATMEQSLGGLLGRSAHNLTVDGITIQNASMQSDVSSSNVKSTGGLIGKLDDGNTVIGNNAAVKVEGCSVTSEGQDNNVRYAAGGLIGHTGGNAALKASRVSLENNQITAGTGASLNGSAGGFIGIAEKNVTLQYYEVKGSTGTVTGTGNAGGVIGYLTGPCTIGPVNAVSLNPLEKVNSVSGITIEAGRNAGGTVGSLNLANAVSASLQDVKTDGAKIIASQAAGGFFGTMEGAGSVYAYRTISSGNRIQVKGTYDMGDSSYAAGGAIGKVEAGTGNLNWSKMTIRDNQIGMGDSENSADKLKLVNQNGILTDLPSTIKEDSLSDYAVHTGSVAGLYLSTGQMHVLHPEIIYTAAFLNNNNRPVTDVGRRKAGSLEEYRENCHIIYNTTFSDAGIKAEAEKYRSGKSTSGILDAYRLSDELLTIFDKSYQNNYTPSGGSITFGQPMLVYKPEYGTVQEVVDTIADMMTNVAGLPASKIKLLEVKAEPMKWENATATPDPGADTSLKTQAEGGTWSFAYQKYDTVTADYATYTLLTFTYSWLESGKTKQETKFAIPVFVEEMLEIDVHTRIIEGNVYNVETLKTKGQMDSILMANDSTYSVLTEYVYGSARKNLSGTTVIPKDFYLKEFQSGAGEQEKRIPEGTKLTLVDITGMGKPYYYTVGRGGVTTVPYTAFLDSQGNAYQNKAIKDLPDVTTDGYPPGEYMDMSGQVKRDAGREQFITMVERPGESGNANEVYTIHSMPVVTDPILLKKMILSEKTKLSIKSIPGLKVSIVTGEGKTDIEGEISKNGKIWERLVFALNANDLYWVEKNGSTGMIDSANHDKFLEAGMYFKDGGNNRIRIPEGTNIRYKTEQGDFTDWRTVNNSSIVYFYKDSGGIYQISDVERNTEVSIEIELDFGVANLAGVKESTYMACIDLLRTSNKDYPMGADTWVGTYEEQIQASVLPQLGFAALVSDLSKLGINTYETGGGEYTIPFDAAFDFVSILDSAGSGSSEELAEKWAGMDYEVKFNIYKKVGLPDGKYAYEPYTGSDIQVADSIYQFSKEEIKSGRVLRKPLEVRLNGGALDLTNYKVKASLSVREKGNNSLYTAVTEDFFIFTVTRIKTDL